MSVRYVVHNHRAELESVSAIGGKASNLCRLQRTVPVPDFYVVTISAFNTALQAQQPARNTSRLLQRLVTGSTAEADQAACELRDLIRRLRWPNDLRQAIQTTHEEKLGEDVAVAVRSSARGEDSSKHSFAGMYETVLHVQGITEVLEAIKTVWSSCFSERAISYRRRHGLPVNDIHLAVIVQQMVDCLQSGVMFTRDPSSSAQSDVLIHAVAGNGDRLVQGLVDAETYRIRNDDKNVCRSANVPARVEGRRTNDVDEDVAHDEVLTECQVRQVGEMGSLVEQLFACPQDVEFCFDQWGTLFVLQSRPITTLASSMTGSLHSIWDNSNIIESYSGVTTPLTFSFIRRAYAIVYECFAEVMGISPRIVEEHRSTFANMLGLFRGRVYYNLKNWYRLVRLFPGYQYNSRFMETMMGVKERVLVEDEPAKPGPWRRGFVELPALVNLTLRICWKFLRIQPIVLRFEQHFDFHYERWSKIDFRLQQPHEILALYRKMEDALLWNWKAPIVNDFYVMVFYGILKQLCTKWCGDQTGSMQNGLLCGNGSVASAEPARRMLEMAREASNNDELCELILNAPVNSLPARVAADANFRSFQTLIDQFLDQYGLRCENELKLEELCYRDRPERVFQLIRDYVARDDATAWDEQLCKERELARRSESENGAFAALANSSSWLPRKWIFRKVLHCTRRGIRNRERLRFARTKIYGIARAMFRAIGDRLAREGVLDTADDIFYLTTEEVWDFIQGTAVSADIRGLADVRRREYEGYRSADAPPPNNRFETHGIPYLDADFRRTTVHAHAQNQAALQGIGCCPGIVEGTVQVVHSAENTAGFIGDILVAQRTDPGWVPLFPAFRGMLVERGSVLSHSAIVAREMGVPTIVGLTGVFERLRTGDRVRMDGQTGTVEILDTDSAPESWPAGPATVDAVK